MKISVMEEHIEANGSSQASGPEEKELVAMQNIIQAKILRDQIGIVIPNGRDLDTLNSQMDQNTQDKLKMDNSMG